VRNKEEANRKFGNRGENQFIGLQNRQNLV